MPFNTTGMYRGTIDAEGRVEIAIFANESAGLAGTEG